VNLRDYGPHVTASLIKQFMSMLLMPIFPAHIYPALLKFPTIPDEDRTQFVKKNIIGRLDQPVVVLLSAVTELLDGICPMLHTIAFVVHPDSTDGRCIGCSCIDKDASFESRHRNHPHPPPPSS
jgi:hypothetical protein